jgi:hypothetical protein
VFHDAATGIIHLRLSPTTNHVSGLADYDGPTDPAEVALALWSNASEPVTIRASSYIELRDLRILGGGESTVGVNGSDHVTFDHVEIRASTVGLHVGESSAVRFVNGIVDGGIPTWSFRSDWKNDYKIALADGSVATNNLVRKTAQRLITAGNGNRELEIAYSELRNGHDLYFAGTDSSLHHCRIGPMQDEALYINEVKDIDNLRVHHNVYERVLSSISSAGKPSGPRYVYRNIYDLRDPTASYRPGVSPKGPWRWGHVFKGNLSSAPFYFYRNTVITRSARPGQPALLHYQGLGKPGTPTQPRWFVDNVVVVAGAGAAPFTFVPGDTFRTAVDDRGRPMMLSDGNAWVRATANSTPLFRCLAGNKGARCDTPRWESIAAVRATGFEAHSKSGTTAGFARIAGVDAAAPGDDLRPGAASVAIGTAVALPSDLPDDDPLGSTDDAGALGSGAAPLYVGVDGRLTY